MQRISVDRLGRLRKLCDAGQLESKYQGRLRFVVVASARPVRRVAERLCAGAVSMSDLHAIQHRLTMAEAAEYARKGVHNGAGHARCSVCLLDSPPAGDQPTAEAWARRHEAQHTDSAPKSSSPAIPAEVTD